MRFPLCSLALAALASAQIFDVASVKPVVGDANGRSVMDGGPLPAGPFIVKPTTRKDHLDEHLAETHDPGGL